MRAVFPEQTAANVSNIYDSQCALLRYGERDYNVVAGTAVRHTTAIV